MLHVTSKTRDHSFCKCNCTEKHMTAGVVENLVLVTQAVCGFLRVKKGWEPVKKWTLHREGANPVCHLVSPLCAHCYPIWDKLVHLIRTCHPYQCSIAVLHSDIANHSGGGGKTWEAGLCSVAIDMSVYHCCVLPCPSSARNFLTCTFSTSCVTAKA